MKPCRSNRKRIVWLLLNALEQDEATDLRTHLQVCAGCREYHLEISRVNHSLSSLQSTVTQNTPLNASASRPRQLIPSRTDLSLATSFIQNILPRLAWPALASVLLATVIIVLVTHHPTAPFLPAHQTNVITAQHPPASVCSPPSAIIAQWQTNPSTSWTTCFHGNANDPSLPRPLSAQSQLLC